MSDETQIEMMTIKNLTAAKLGSKTSIYRDVAAGKFPKPIKLGGRTVWRKSTIIEFLNRKESESV